MHDILILIFIFDILSRHTHTTCYIDAVRFSKKYRNFVVILVIILRNYALENVIITSRYLYLENKSSKLKL